MIPQGYPLYATVDSVDYVIVGWGPVGTHVREVRPLGVALDGSTDGKAVILTGATVSLTEPSA